MAQNTIHHKLISISKSYHDTTEKYLTHFGKFTAATIIPALLTYILIAGIIVVIFAGVFEKNIEISDLFSFSNPYFYAVIGIALLSGVIQVLATIALIYLVVNDQKPTVLSAFEHGFHFFWRFVALAIALTCAMIVGMVLGYLIVMLLGVLMGMLSLNVFAAVFNWLTIIPAGITAAITAFFIFSGFIIVKKNLSIRQALKESMHLVHMTFWPVALRLIILYAMVTVCSYALQFIPVVGNILALVLLTPFSVIYVGVLYNDLNKEQTA